MMTRKSTLTQISDHILTLLSNYPEDREKAGEAILQLHDRVMQLRDEDPELAIKYCEIGLTLTRGTLQTSTGIDPTLGEALSLLCLGTIYTSLDRLEEAADCFRRGAEQFHSIAKRVSESIAYFALARVREHVQRRFEWTEVLGAYQQALSALKDTTGLSFAPMSNVEQLRREIQLELSQAMSRMEKQLKSSRVARPQEPPRPIAPGFLQIPVIARIAAGEPILAYTDDEEPLLVGEEIARGGNVAVHIRGDSMVGAGILDDDYVLIREQPVAHNGDIVAVLVRDIDTEAALKRYFRYSDHVLLKAENPAIRSMVIVPDQATAEKVQREYDSSEFDVRIGSEVIIRGKAVAVIRTLET
jgi:SOS-response transcriptional repressor LexA